MIEKLAQLNTEIAVYDPVVKQLDKTLNPTVNFFDSVEDAVKDADCLVIMAEWDEFKSVDLENTYKLMRTPVICDTRNVIPAKQAIKTGFKYKGIGTALSV